MMKGQSAIEYLMTYGWMLIVVSIAGGAVYSTTGSQCVESINGFSGQGVAITDFTVSGETGNLVVLIDNNGADTVEINEVSVSDRDEEAVQNPESMEISPGGSETLELSEGFTTSNQCNSYSVGINYDEGGLSGLDIGGDITGGIELVEEPDAPEIESVNQ